MDEIYVRNNNSWAKGTSGKIYLCTYGKNLMVGEGTDAYTLYSNSDGSGVISNKKIIPAYVSEGSADPDSLRLLTRGFNVGGIKIKISFDYSTTNLKFSSSSSGNHRFGYEVAYRLSEGSTYTYYGAWIKKGDNGFTDQEADDSGSYTKEGTISNEISFSRGERDIGWNQVIEGRFYLQGINGGSVTFSNLNFQFFGFEEYPIYVYKNGTWE